VRERTVARQSDLEPVVEEEGRLGGDDGIVQATGRQRVAQQRRDIEWLIAGAELEAGARRRHASVVQVGEQAEKRHGERDVHPRSARRSAVATGYRAHLTVDPVNGVIPGFETVLGCGGEFREARARALAPGWPLWGVMSPGIEIVERR